METTTAQFVNIRSIPQSLWCDVIWRTARLPVHQQAILKVRLGELIREVIQSTLDSIDINPESKPAHLYSSIAYQFV